MASKELVISQSRHETKVGILEDGQLVEVFFQRANEYSLAGSIHKGRVTRVLPGMQSAFVDLGLERDCFLYVSDFFDEHGDEFDKVGDDRRGRDRDRDRDRGRGREERAPRQEAQRPIEGEPASADAPEVALPVAGAGIPEEPAAGPAPQDDDGQDRSGRRRRSRRRRRGGRGFPESKYAEATDAAEGETEAAEPELEAVADLPQPEAEPEIVLLPGESLAKYRRGQQPASVSPAPTPVPVTESPTLDELSEADYEEAAEEAAQEILERIEELEEHADAYSPAVEEPSSGIDEEAESEAEAEAEFVTGETAEAEDDSEDEEIPAVESEEESEPAAFDEEAPALAAESEEGIESSADAGEAAPASAEEPGEEGPEPARMPQSLTATLRAQGGRYPHRMTRRGRRRGRGGQGTEQPTGSPETTFAPETVEITHEAPGRPVERERSERERPDRERERPERERGRERGRDKDRERSESADRSRPPLPSIADLLKEGQEIIVQIAKEPLGQKGARITSHIALPGRYVVYMPTVDHLGVSRKISTDEERQRLKRILQKHREGVQGGYIMRTAGEGRSEEDIAADMQYLANLWLDIKAKADKRRAPALLHHDVEVVQRLLRDQLTEGFKAVWVDNEDLYEQVLHAVERMQPTLLSRVKLYTRHEPIFDAFGITQELEKALRPKVWLKSGGYIVINQTEALVAIDVNTGKYVGKSNRLEDTIVKTNLEAVKEIVRQIRLRDLGGIIVVDFIDMDERKNRQKVMQSLEETMRNDKAPYKVLQFNDFGLVAITRKRVKQSLERTLCSPCPYCEGAGYVKSVQTVLAEILNQAQKYAKVVDGKDCVLRVNPEVAKLLKSTETRHLEELEEVLGRPVLVVGDDRLHQEKFDLT